MPIPEPDLDPDAWDEAKRRFAVCRALAGVRRTLPMVQEAADRLGLSVPQFYRLLDQYEHDPTVKAMLPARRGPKVGHRRLPSETEGLIACEITNFYETRESPSLKDLYEHIGAKLQEAGLPQVDSRTIRRRVAKKSKRELAKPRVGAKRAAALYGPIQGHLESGRLLDIVQMDHTQVDIMVVDETTRLPVHTRPWLTVLIDVASRMVVGFYLSFDRPNARSVAMAIAHGVLPKADYCRRVGVQSPYPAAGLPRVLHLDNAKEFKSAVIKQACENFGITLAYRPPATPRFGGHVERLIGTLMRAAHLLPGTTKSNPRERGDYKSETWASMTLPELEHWLALEIIDKYHNRVHESLGVSPLHRWNTLSQAPDSEVRYPNDPENFFRWFLPEEHRCVGRHGVEINGLVYRDAIINRLVKDGKRHRFKYDPWDVTRVWYVTPAGEWHPVRCEQLDLPVISLWEVKTVRKALRLQGRQNSKPKVIRDAVLAQRRIIETAAVASRKARALAQKIPDRAANPLTPPAAADPIPVTPAGGSIAIDFDAIDVPLLPGRVERWDDWDGD